MRALFFALSFVVSLSGLAVESHEASARYLVHLLAYIAGDYGGAVSEGKVISPTEYREQIEFVDAAIETEQKLKETQHYLKDNAEVAAGLRKLKALVAAKRDAVEVKRAARAVESLVIQLAGIKVAPSKWPDLRHGRTLFAQSCATCHGPGGRGDGPAAAGLDPRPTNFHDAKLAGAAPFQLYNAIRLGVPGTAMPSFETFSDQEAWDLAFYVSSLRHQEGTAIAAAGSAGKPPPPPKSDLPRIDLKDLTTTSDEDLANRLAGTEAERAIAIREARLYVPSEGPGTSLVLAKRKLGEALTLWEKGEYQQAKQASIVAYLEGVEPVEPSLRAKNPSFTASLEERMGEVRQRIDRPGTQPADAVREAIDHLTRAEVLLEEKSGSAWVTFVVAAGIFLREGFEAVLILITLLGVIRSIGSRRAAIYVHAGWILALAVGCIMWLFSGWMLEVSGAGREMLEGCISLAAVVVLLYFGFWLHRKTEIGKWKAFLGDMVRNALDTKKLWGLGGIAFMAVFRESLETVLFLRAVSLESDGQFQPAILAGVLVSLVLILILASALLRFSAKLPLRQLFAVSSLVMVALSFILIGKAFHSFQEVGLIPITRLPFPVRSDLVGLYPTYETLVPQLMVMALALVAWWLGRRETTGPASLSNG